MNSSTPKRHLSRSGIDEYLLMSAPATFTVPGSPICRIVVDPLRREMALQTPYLGHRAEITDFEHVRSQVISEGGMAWNEVIIEYHDHGREAYLVLSDIADLIQQNSLPFEISVKSALKTFEDLLVRAGRLSVEHQTGLYGELLFLESCMRYLPPDVAVDAWKGFSSNEHDFVFFESCFEIKSTRIEKRHHQIGSLEQLQPIPGSRLWLISVQLTSTSASLGRTLAELIDDVSRIAGPARTKLDSALMQAGWRERDRPHYRDSLTLRSTPAAYSVDKNFPVLSRKVIEQGCAHPELIINASYMVDVTSFLRASPPAPACHFVEEGQ